MGTLKEANEKDVSYEDVPKDAFAIDVIFSHLGRFGKVQLTFIAMMSFAAFFPASSVSSFALTGYVPKYRCFFDGIDDETAPVFDVDWLNHTIPDGYNDTLINKCQRFNVTLENIDGSAPLDTSNLIQCNRWIFDDTTFKSTLATSFGLICDNEWKNDFVGVLTMIGLMVGSLILGPFPDLIGRRTAFLVLVLWMTSSGIGSTFAPDYDTYAVLRFLTGMGGMALIQTNIIWGLEFMVPETRIKYIFILGFFQAVGNLIIGGSFQSLAYFLRDWRYLQLVIFCPMVLLVGHFFILPESARWLVAKNKYPEAKTVLEKVAKTNGKTIPANFLEVFVLGNSSESDGSENDVETANITQSEVSFRDLIKSPTLMKRLFILCMAWAASFLCYYGLTYASAHLQGDLFLNYILVVIVEIPACLIGMFIVEYLGRRTMTNVTLILGGAACLAAGLMDASADVGIVVCSMIGKFLVSLLNITINIMTSEAFPTSIRSIVIAICAIAGKIGSILAPILAGMGKDTAALPYFIFGISSICVGFLTFFLPETKGQPMPSSIADAKALDKYTISCQCKKK